MHENNEYITQNLLEVIKEGLTSKRITSIFDYKTNVNKQEFNTRNSKKILAIIAYIFPLWLAGLIIYPSDENVNFHVKQGINLMVFFLTINLAINILNFIFILISPLFVMFTALIYTAGNILVLCLIIIGCINAAKGKLKPLPIIGKNS